MFTGVYTALITPFKAGKVDEAAFSALVDWQVAEGIHGLVPCGTTGESPTLDYAEHIRVIELCVQAAKKRVPVMAGTGSNATHEAIALTQAAEKVGADAALLVAPYYNKPTEAGLYAHFKAIHDATSIPLVLYNVPGRTVTNMSNELIAQLSELPRIVGLKDATGDLERPRTLRLALGDRAQKFLQLSGEDSTVLPFNLQGGQGVISVTANIAPKLCSEVHNLWFSGYRDQAITLQDTLMPVHKIMFCETSPGPVKYAASLLNKSSEDLRLPLVPPSDAHKKKIKEAMKTAGIL